MEQKSILAVVEGWPVLRPPCFSSVDRVVARAILSSRRAKANRKCDERPGPRIAVVGRGRSLSAFEVGVETSLLTRAACSSVFQALGGFAPFNDLERARFCSRWLMLSLSS
jgi:hypothetical protein